MQVVNMKKDYYRCIIILLMFTIICLLIYFLTYEKCNVLSNVFGNMSVGFITGFVLLLITNKKNAILYKNNNCITEIKNILSYIREIEIKIINYDGLEKLSNLDLLDTYSDLSNILERIHEFNSNYFEKKQYNFEDMQKDYDERLNKLCLVREISKEVYDKKYSEDLAEKMCILYKLRWELRKELEKLEMENEKMNISIF